MGQAAAQDPEQSPVDHSESGRTKQIRDLEKLIEGGLWRYVIRHGVLAFGVPMALFFAVFFQMDSGFSVLGTVLILGFVPPLAGGPFGLIMWHFLPTGLERLRDPNVAVRTRAREVDLLFLLGFLPLLWSFAITEYLGNAYLPWDAMVVIFGVVVVCWSLINRQRACRTDPDWTSRPWWSRFLSLYIYWIAFVWAGLGHTIRIVLLAAGPDPID